jgi:hypothetical protein
MTVSLQDGNCRPGPVRIRNRGFLWQLKADTCLDTYVSLAGTRSDNRQVEGGEYMAVI